MSTSVVLIAGCAIVTAAIKSAGPVILGGRELPVRFLGVVSLLAPALLAASTGTPAGANGTSASAISAPIAAAPRARPLRASLISRPTKNAG